MRTVGLKLIGLFLAVAVMTAFIVGCGARWQGPAGPAGMNGKDGKDAIAPLVFFQENSICVLGAYDSVPRCVTLLGGKDGLAGTNGTNGVNGTNGTNGIDGTNGFEPEVFFMGNSVCVLGSNDAVPRCVALPGGRDGTNGIDGTNGTNGTNGIDGTNGTNGIDGANVIIINGHIGDNCHVVHDTTVVRDSTGHENQSHVLCHYPPGNIGNAHTLHVGVSAIAAHMAEHGDHLGACTYDELHGILQ